MAQRDKISEEKITNILKERKKLSTSKIASLCNYDYAFTKRELEEMEKQKKVKKIQETLGTFWAIKK